MRIRSPEQLFGAKNTSRKLVVMGHELITIKLRKTITDLSEFAKKIKEAEFDRKRSRGVIIKTRWGAILVHAGLVQLQQIRDLSKVNLLATFLHQALNSDREMSFADWIHGLPIQANIEKTKEELT
jgi:hypothetical protein